MNTTIKIIDKNDPLCGKEYPGYLIFYDVYYRGGSNEPIEDLYLLEIDCKKHKYVTSQIDEAHYKNQILNIEIDRLGANIGDKVRVIDTGSGSYGRAYLDRKNNYGFHTITDITPYGYVTFDNGEAKMFRPKVEKIN